MDHVAKRSWSVADHQSTPGASFSQRYSGLHADVEQASRQGLWQYFRRHERRAAIEATIHDEAGRRFSGLNVGSQDYLGLANDPRVADAAIEAIREYGLHSSGSAPMGGGSLIGDALAARISAVLEVDHTLLFPTGWAAGYGVIRGIVRPHDFVVIDALAHNCLQHGAEAATPNVTIFSHNSADSLRKRVARIRKANPDAAILIVTESLFSMDSDTPPISDIVAVKQEYGAHLLLDIAHDFGILGPGGTGFIRNHAPYRDIEFVIGSFSKTFASIGGFFSTNDMNLIRGVQGYSGSYTFSNYLIPPQIAAVARAFDIAFSEEGNLLRGDVLRNCRRMREKLAAAGIETTGVDSAMIIIKVGEEDRARDSYRKLLSDGLVLNCIEYPAVRRGDARFRLQLTPHHTDAEIDLAAAKIVDALR